jgi:sulfur-carrier protein
MKIHVYASLKDYFTPEFELDGPVSNTIELTARLVAMNGQAEGILSSCRFAVEEGFIEPDFQLNEHDTIVIIPPGSGG